MHRVALRDNDSFLAPTQNTVVEERNPSAVRRRTSACLQFRVSNQERNYIKSRSPVKVIRSKGSNTHLSVTQYFTTATQMINASLK